MSDPIDLPVIPLRDTVLFPGTGVPITIGRRGTIAALREALASESKRVFAATQHLDDDTVTPDKLWDLGAIARIIQSQSGPNGVQLVLEVEGRGRALDYAQNAETGGLRARVQEVERLEPRDPDSPAFLALEAELRDRAAELGRRRGVPLEALTALIGGIEDPGGLADMIAFHLNARVDQKQRLLEMLDDEDRMRATLVAVERELARLEAQGELKQKVQEELGERQRESYLREQLKQIYRELGEEDTQEEADELNERIEALELPEEAQNEVERELRRLRRTSPESAEYQVIRTFLEWIIELPWSTRTEDELDVARAEGILDEDHYGLEEVKDRILEFLAVRKLRIERAADQEIDSVEAAARAVGKGSILLFAGPPGVGKTSIGKSIARALGREYVRVSLGGARDEADIRGHRRTYVGALPGRIIQGLRRAKSKNPVFLLDEIDKLGASFQGDPSAALLEVLDPAQNTGFTDHYLGLPFDLSEVLFIATANYVDRIPAPLLDRMERVDFAGYTEHEKLEIAKRHLLATVRSEAGLEPEEMDLPDDVLLTLIRDYTREAGVRQLAKVLDKLARKIARAIAGPEESAGAIDQERLRAVLGRPRVHAEEAADTDQIGIATGMTYTPVGGDIIFVEASIMPGDGKLVLTGQLGEVMKESARAALTYAKTRHAELGVEEARLKGVDLHIHVPAGAIPKDGPSAGVTMATALVSALAGRAVRRDVAMTGEVTLNGRVLPIGGLKEKVLGAERAGIETIVLPRKNEADLEDIPEEIRQRLTFHLVDALDEVLDVALVRDR